MFVPVSGHQLCNCLPIVSTKYMGGCGEKHVCKFLDTQYDVSSSLFRQAGYYISV